jgi:GNAT superfamily N-acetyltransferase
MNAPIPTTGIRLVGEHDADGAGLLRRLHDEVIAPSFPPEEYVPPGPDDDLDTGDPYLIACAADGTVAGGALGEHYLGSRAVLLGYLAARPGWRGRRVGSLLFEAVIQRWVGPHTLGLLEIEDPRHSRHRGAAETYGDAAARVRFYARHGVRAIAAPYFQPSLGPHLSRAYHMMLCVMGEVPAELVADGGISAGPVLDFLLEYFRLCEGGEPADAQGRWLLDAYRGAVLPLVAVDDLARIPDPEPPAREPAARGQAG